MKRRSFIQSSAALVAASPVSSVLASKEMSFIDTNVYLGQHPFRSLPLESPDALAARLRKIGVVSAWAAPMEALLHRDLDSLNEQHWKTCQSSGGELFVPIGAINPKLPGWRESLRRCHEVHGMKGVRIHPGYHGYDLNDPDFAHLLAAVKERNLLLQLAPHMEDQRTQHPKVIVPPTNPTPLLKLLPKFPGLRFQIINGLRTINSGSLLKILSEAGAHFDISMLEGAAGIAQSVIPAERLCFGSYAPVFIPESASLKVVESKPELDDARLQALCHGNAESLLPA